MQPEGLKEKVEFIAPESPTYPGWSLAPEAQRGVPCQVPQGTDMHEMSWKMELKLILVPKKI